MLLASSTIVCTTLVQTILHAPDYLELHVDPVLVMMELRPCARQHAFAVYDANPVDERGPLGPFCQSVLRRNIIKEYKTRVRAADL